jgi:hypothetical protein
MVFIICGALAFALYLLYDINGAGKNLAVLKPLFTVGTVLLTGTTAAVIWRSKASLYTLTPVFAVLAIGMLVLLTYTLFFALPFKGAYVDGRPPLCTTGMYALCRHPGILWFGLMYAAIYGALPCALTASGALVFTALDIGYALFQDIYTFPRIFSGYENYKQTTPFIIPTPESIKKALSGK